MTPLTNLFLRFVGQTSPTPMSIEVTKAEGIYLYTPEGKRYTDLISGVSVTLVAVIPGDVSVSPYTLIISLQCIFSITCFIDSIGQGAPAIIPVRNEVRSKRSNIG